MKLSIFLQHLQEQHGSEATDSLKDQFSLDEEDGMKDADQVSIDPIFATETLSKMKTKRTSNVRVKTKTDKASGKELINYIQWFSPLKNESYY